MKIILPAGGGGSTTQKNFLYIGGRAHYYTSLSEIIELGCVAAGGGTPGYSTLAAPTSTSGAGYQVTAGKTLHIIAAKILMQTLPSGAILKVGYGDTDVGIGSASAPTSPKYYGGYANNGFIAGIGYGQASDIFAEVAIDFSVPAGKYPFLVADAGSYFYARLWGIEI